MRRRPGRPRKPFDERLHLFPTLRARHSVVQWYARRRSSDSIAVARAALEALSLLGEKDFAALEALAISRRDTLAETIARAITDAISE